MPTTYRVTDRATGAVCHLTAAQLAALPGPPAPKYDARRSLADVKRGIVADIRAAVAAGKLPAGSYVVSARCGKGSMCRPTISVAIDGLPFAVLDARFAEHVRETQDRVHYIGERFCPEARATLRIVEQIVGSYGYDKSDSQSDHFDYAFNEHVSLVAHTREYAAALAGGV